MAYILHTAAHSRHCVSRCLHRSVLSEVVGERLECERCEKESVVCRVCARVLCAYGHTRVWPWAADRDPPVNRSGCLLSERSTGAKFGHPRRPAGVMQRRTRTARHGIRYIILFKQQRH